MLVLAALVLGLASPPRAYLDAGATRVPLAISSWCWGARCGAPIAASRRIAYAKRGSTARVELAFVPTEVRLAVNGVPVLTVRHAREVDWRVRRGGGLTMTVTGVHGWVTYVGRLVLR